MLWEDRRISARFAANADRGSTWSAPAFRAEAISSVWTCEANARTREALSAGSALSAAIVATGSVFPLFRSKMTSDGFCAVRLVENFLRRPREGHVDARLLCGGANLRAEEKVVDGG